MKKLLIFAVITIFVCMTSCGDSNNEPDYPVEDDTVYTISAAKLQGKWNLESIQDDLTGKEIELNIPLTIGKIDVNKAQLYETEGDYESWLGIYDGCFESFGPVETPVVCFHKKVGSPLSSSGIAEIMVIIRESPLSDDVTVVILGDFHSKDGYLVCDGVIEIGNMPIGGDLEPAIIYQGTVKMKKIK